MMTDANKVCFYTGLSDCDLDSGSQGWEKEDTYDLTISESLESTLFYYGMLLRFVGIINLFSLIFKDKHSREVTLVRQVSEPPLPPKQKQLYQCLPSRILLILANLVSWQTLLNCILWYQFEWPWSSCKFTVVWQSKHFVLIFSQILDRIWMKCTLLPWPVGLMRLMLNLFCLISVQKR